MYKLFNHKENSVLQKKVFLWSGFAYLICQLLFWPSAFRGISHHFLPREIFLSPQIWYTTGTDRMSGILSGTGFGYPAGLEKNRGFQKKKQPTCFFGGLMFFLRVFWVLGFLIFRELGNQQGDLQ